MNFFNRRFGVAFLLALFFHGLLLYGLKLILPTNEKPPERFLRVEYLGYKPKERPPPPDRVEAMAEEDQRASAPEITEQEAEETAPEPLFLEPETELAPTPPTPPESGEPPPPPPRPNERGPPKERWWPTRL
ncbi:MAG: hypothetical protein HQL52_19560 [Magnetococcales bacterium]|nr:hypothetical protein [Magnetococcales bacterium]